MKISLMEPVCNAKMIRASVNALKNERFLRGKSVEEFESNFAKYIGVKHAVAVNSGSSALSISLISMGIKKGDCVITTPFSFIATANVILAAGAEPIFADVSEQTYNIDPKKVEEEIKKHGEKIKAILPVHLYGYPANMAELGEIARSHNLKILEDACQAHGAVYKGAKVGSIGDAAAFSFYPAKNMTVCGDGGMITTNDSEVAEIAMSLRDNGRAKDNAYLHQYMGFTARMHTSGAAIGNVQLTYLDRWIRKKRRVARQYYRGLKGVGGIVLPPQDSRDTKSANHLYVVRTDRRDDLMRHLKDKEIECGVHYPIPIHLQPPYKARGFSEGMFTNAEECAKHVLSIPIHQNLDSEKVEYVIESIKEFYK